MNEKEYLQLSLEERQKHIDLQSPCLERGGISTNHRGVLAQYLNTNVFSSPVDLCHKCNNGKCSNPQHLYWGTRKENIQDAKDNGTWKGNPFENSVAKYGYEEACKRQALNSEKAALGGKAGKGRKLTEEHKKKISETLKNKLRNTLNET